MKYRSFGKTNERISAIGFGCMRLPTTDGVPLGKNIDEEKAVGMIRFAIDNGVNYLDTAYPYHQGMSEVVVGKALKDGYREKTFVATKSPTFDIKCEEDFDRILDDQLKKLDIDCIDFYLMHALDRNRWNNIVLKFNLLPKLEKAQADGKIRHIGFSFHDDYEAFKMIVDGFDKWEFCQIQLNYIDINHQAGIKGLEYAASKGLGVVIMEPLLGGKLAVPPVNVAKVLPDTKTPVEWALDFLWNREEIGFMLSGMGEMEQVKQNIEYANRSEVGMLTKAELDMLAEAKVIFDTMSLVSCTRCAYCMPCPAGLDIPKIYEAYNASASVNMRRAKEMYDALEVHADKCVGCKQCEKACPQAIETSVLMKEIDKVFA